MKLPKENSVNPFGEWIKNKRKAKKWSVRKLAEEANVCHYSLISQIENNTYVRKKGKPMKTDEEIIVGLAKALGQSTDEALNLAGYVGITEKTTAKTSEVKKPKSFAEFAEVLEAMGIFDLQMFGGEKVFSNFTEFDYQLFLERMRNDVLIEVKRKGAGK